MIGVSELHQAIQQLDVLVRMKVVDKAVRAGAKPVQKRMRANAPDSRKTGSLAKQSKSTHSKWKNAARLKNVIRSVVRLYPGGAAAYVGPSYTDGGGHGNFFSPRTHERKVLWGKEPKFAASRVVNQFVKNAADQSKEEAKSALISSAKKAIEEMFKKVRLK